MVHDSDSKNEIIHQPGVRSQEYYLFFTALLTIRKTMTHDSYFFALVTGHWPRNCRQVQLCAHHWAARTTMYQQASKKDKALSATLAEMERNSPEEFAEHVHNFSEECYGSNIRQHNVNVYQCLLNLLGV